MLERLRLVDGEPVSFQASYLPAALGVEVSKADLAVTPLRQVLAFKLGIDITAEHPKILTVDAVQDSDVIITMGCGDACPIFPGKRYEDWKLDDPAGQDLETVRGIRNDLDARVRADA